MQLCFHQRFLAHSCIALLLVGCTRDSGDQTSTQQVESAEIADLNDIVGVEIGGTQSFPECSKDYHSTTGMRYGFPSKVTPCWQFPILLERYRESMKSKHSSSAFPVDLENGEELDLHLGERKAPEGVYGPARITLIEGKIEGISLQTRASDQYSINALLTTKYGPPTASGSAQLQNGFGAQFNRIESRWDMPRMTVYFFGITSDPDEGGITALSPKLAQFLNEKKSKESRQF